MLNNSLIKNISLYRHRSVYVRLIFTLLALVIMPVLAISTIYINTFLEQIQSEILNSNRIRLAGISESIDKNLNSIEQSLLNILLGNDIKVTESMLIENPLSARYKLSLSCKYLSKIIITSSLIDEIFVYYKKAGIVFSSSSVVDLNTYFETLNKYKDYGAVFWNNYFEDNIYKDNNVIPSMDIYYSVNDTPRQLKKVITFVRSVNQFKENPTVIYGIVVKHSEISDIINRVNITNKGCVFITDNKFNIVFSNDINNKFSSAINSELVNKAAVNSINTVYKLNNENVNIITAYSAKYDIWYISVIPSEEVVNSSKYVKNVFILFFIIIIGLAAIAVFIAGGWLYKPVNGLVDLINNASGKIEGNKNEIDYINSKISSIINNSKTLNAAFKRSLPFTREKILGNLINGAYHFYDDNPDIAGTFEINLANPYFQVCVIVIDNIKAFNYRYNELERETQKFYIENICEEIFDKYAASFLIDSNKLCVLLNFENESKFKNKLFSYLELIQNNTEELMSITVSIGIGTVKSDVHEIHVSYQEAVRALSFRTVNGSRQIIDYSKACSANSEYYYSADRENSIFNYLKVGDHKSAIEMIEYIVAKNFECNTSYRHLNYVLMEILGTMLKALYEMGGKIQDIFGMDVNLSDELFENEAKEDIMNWFSKNCMRLCDYIIQNQESGNKKLIKNIIRYISDNYNKELTLENIADQFNMSYSYLSRYFKQQTGMNFINYLYQFRMEKAKNMLLNSNMKIGEVGEKVGFSNTVSFIRIFRKYVGTTPGKFKDS